MDLQRFNRLYEGFTRLLTEMLGVQVNRMEPLYHNKVQRLIAVLLPVFFILQFFASFVGYRVVLSAILEIFSSAWTVIRFIVRMILAVLKQTCFYRAFARIRKPLRISEHLESKRASSEFLTEPQKNRSVLAVCVEWRPLQMHNMIGTAFRVQVAGKPVVVAPAHIINGQKTIVLIDYKDEKVETQYEDWIQTGIDLVYLRCSGKFVDLAHLPAFKTGCMVGIDVTARSAYTERNVSIGMLRSPLVDEHNVAFGKLIYTGSTRPGFSGAPYIQGQTAHGMHTNGGMVNTGYSMSFITCVIQSNENKIGDKLEASENDALERMLKTARKTDVQYARWGVDEYMVSVGGRHFVVDEDDFAALAGKRDFRKYFYDDEDRHMGITNEGATEVAAQIETLALAVRTLTEKVEKMTKVCDVVAALQLNVDSLLDFQERASEQPNMSEINSGLKQLEANIDSLTQNTDSIQSSLDSHLEILAGLSVEQEQLSTHCRSTLENAVEQAQVLDRQTEKNLKEWLEQRLLDIRTPTTDPPVQTIQPSIPISTSSSPPSIQQVPQASETSKDIPTSDLRWDGMEFAMVKYLSWKNSVDGSSPDFAAWREQYLLGELKLTPSQASRLISWSKNKHARQRAKISKTKKQDQQISNSSSKTSPTRERSCSVGDSA